MPRTRPQRVSMATATFVAGMVVILLVVWNQRLYATTWHATGGRIVREFGLVRYLTITREVTGPIGNAAAQTMVSNTWNWRVRGVLVNLVITGVAGAVLALGCRRMVRKNRLFDHCDECGYDLTGLRSAACPECGARLGPVAEREVG